MAIWNEIISERDRQVFQNTKSGNREGFGRRPALLVVDVTYDFVGDRPEPILQSIQRFRLSCGEEGWQSILCIKELLQGARECGVPVFYTAPADRSQSRGRWRAKYETLPKNARHEWANNVVQEIAPVEGEVLIRKEKASAFFGTPLAGYLVDLGVDTLLVTGGTTSGCVRATVIDGFSYNFKVAVVAECTFDRYQVSHRVSLFDMNRYADIVSLEDAQAYMLCLPTSLPARA